MRFVTQLLLLITGTSAFTNVPLKIRSPATTHLHSSSTVNSEDIATAANSQGQQLLTRDRYVATNRFNVRKGQEAAFEKRWATRKSKLATLQGFKYFHLMRRVSLDTNTYDGDGGEGNYVSFTIWNKKKDFGAWRSGEAFKEAHGGTSLFAFVSTMINSAKTLQSPPRPAFYDGLLLQSVKPEFTSKVVDGWRADVAADGVEILPAECFVACNQFYVLEENRVAFETLWAQRESKLKECEGFVAFSMLRRDASAKGHGTSPMDYNAEPTYLSTTIWKDRAAFDAWRSGTTFQQAHSSSDHKKKPQNDDSNKTSDKNKPLWSKPPQPVFYEGTLVITSEEGA